MTKPTFQDFSQISNPDILAPRVQQLRKTLKKKNLAAFLVPRSDVYKGEAVQKCDERLAYISGFTGSTGIAAIGLKKAAIFVDGRYTLQAPKQTDLDIFEVIETPPNKVTKWLQYNFKKKSTIGFDAWFHSPNEIKELQKKLKGHLKLKPVENLIDKIWQDRPKPLSSKIKFLTIERSGKTASEKIAELQQIIATAKCDNLIITTPENICWLFNMRGQDVPNTPIVLSFAIIPAAGTPTIFLPKEQINHDTLAALDAIAHLEDKNNFANALAALGKNKPSIWIDSNFAPFAIKKILQKSGAKLFEKPDPITAIKAIKNSTELKGMKKAHLLDGIAMVKFLCWFDENAPSGKLNEIEIVKRLESFRREEKTLADISFDTIAGAGENGAIVHYRVNDNSNKTLKQGELMLVDSGGQYLSGTTDITRTLFCGSASNEQKQRYTQVLKGMIAISILRFPKGTTGGHLDILARQFLWQDGKNYSHGTGHGVGAYLSVHEGPFSISPRANLPIKVGIILSNEPGFYKQGEYGIRIENLIHVKQSDVAKDFLEFETLTLAPIDTRLIDNSLLTKTEVNWLNAYHQRVWKALEGKLNKKVRSWLKAATNPIKITKGGATK